MEKSMVLIPGEYVTTTMIKLPKVSRREQLKLLPFALEDKILGNLERLHFELSKTHEQQVYAVAVIEKSILLRYAAQDESVIPDYLSLPWRVGRWTVSIEKDRALIRFEKNKGCICEVENLIAWFGLQENLPKGLDCYGDQAAFQKLEHALSIPCEYFQNENELNENWLPDFNFSSKRSFKLSCHFAKYSTKAWGITGAVLLLVVMFGAHLFQLSYLSSKNKQMLSSIVRIQDEQSKWLQFQKHRAFFVLMGKVAPVLSQEKSLTLRELYFTQRGLTLTIQVPTLDKLNAVVKELARNELSVKQEKVTDRNGYVIATLVTN